VVDHLFIVLFILMIMEIILIAAVAKNNVIGKDGKIPWDIPEDKERFHELTSGHTVIMGRKTFETCTNGTLPGRKNIVVSTTKKEVTGALVFESLQEALGRCTGKVFIIGGGQIFAEAMRYADKLLITHVDKDIEGDVFFPEIDKSWNQITEEFGHGVVYSEYIKN